jgi:hypothetical protein
MSIYINDLVEKQNTFYQTVRFLPHTVRAALMGPGDQPAFGGAGGLWQPGVVIPAGGVPLAMSLLAFARSEKSAPCASPGKKP